MLEEVLAEAWIPITTAYQQHGKVKTQKEFPWASHIY